MITLRPPAARGGADYDWLKTRHTFSFDTYHDPAWMHFRSLRVINEDWIAPGRGFGMHPHRDMEILTYVLEGALQHQDSLGNGSVIRPGDAQRMSAGTGIVHGEANPSASEPVHLLQIWILPEKRGFPPSYEQKTLPPWQGLRRIAGPKAGDGALTLHQDTELWVARLAAGETAEHALVPGRHAWIQVARGSVELNGTKLNQGDGAGVSDEQSIRLKALEPAEVLVFDLA